MEVRQIILRAIPALTTVGIVLFQGSAWALSPGDARHLLNRTGFGASPHEIKQLLPMDRYQAVDYLLNKSRQQASFLPATLLQDISLDSIESNKLLRDKPKQKKRKQVLKRKKKKLLKSWWHYEILNTSSPLSERMTLFWHNHFTSSLAKVHQPELMLQQNRLFRRHALGNFADLLHAVAKDPAMLIYLDGKQNRKAKANENFARELLELFTLGEGHYQEADIKAAARAFTGWSLDKNKQFIKRTAQHDPSDKVFMGYQGAFDGEDILDILLHNPQTARFIVTKLWLAFISPEPDLVAIQHWASYWQQQNRYELKPLMKRILTSEAFWHEQNRGSLIKSPLDITLGTLRSLEIQPHKKLLTKLSQINRQLGQDLFDPPNVKGWPGQEHWIDAKSLSFRQNFLTKISRGMEIPEQNMMRNNAKMSLSEQDMPLSEWRLLLLPLPPLNSAHDLGDILLDPVFQLK